MDATTTLWKRLWDHDPNGLIVLDERMQIVLVNPALCRMLKTETASLIGSAAADILGDISEFRRALTSGAERGGR